MKTISIRRLLVWGLLTLVLLSCNLSAPSQPTVAPSVITVNAVPQPTETPPPPASPTVPPPPTESPTPALPFIEYQGVRFSYSPMLAANVSVETVPASPESNDTPYWDQFPEHLKFTFNGYLLANTFHEAHVWVYPVQGLQQKSEGATMVIAELRQVLTNRPQAPESLPMLPIFNAAQLLRVQVSYLRFGSGQGVRYLSQYAQYAAPINNKELFYTFQGITDDGRYYVAAVMPISHPNLPADAETFMQGKDWNQFSEVYQPYVQEMARELNGFDGESFSPSLSQLDQIFSSLTINK